MEYELGSLVDSGQGSVRDINPNALVRWLGVIDPSPLHGQLESWDEFMQIEYKEICVCDLGDLIGLSGKSVRVF